MIGVRALTLDVERIRACGRVSVNFRHLAVHEYEVKDALAAASIAKAPLLATSTTQPSFSSIRMATLWFT